VPEGQTSHRYVVLHHTGIDEPHFDFMFETAPGSPLTTFRLSQWPEIENTEVTKLRDHRRAYLTYEGDVSSDRGRVDRVAEGEVMVVRSGSGWLLQHADGRPFMTLEPLGGSDAQWFLRLLDVR